MYDKHDRFNLCLKTIATSVAIVNAGLSQDDRNVVVRFTGLPFVNETYSQRQNVNLSSIILTPFAFSTNTMTNLFLTNEKQFTFAKFQEVCNIRINYTRSATDTNPTTAVVFPSFVFVFEIYGI
jgi:hypothetical protein